MMIHCPLLTLGFLLACCASAPEPQSSSPPDVADVAGETTVDVLQPDEPAGPCTLNERVGRFQIAHFANFSGVVGSVSAGVIPLTVLQPMAEAGDCVLLRKENPFCDPPCQAGDLCDHDGSCIAYPATTDLGTLSIDGLSQPLSIEPLPNNEYAYTELSVDAWSAGSWITLTVPGGELPGFELSARGVSPMEAPAEKWNLDAGAPLVVTWTPRDDHARIWLSLNVDQHGTTPVTLFCDAPDTGELTIATALVDSFLTFGVSGFAVGKLVRRSVDSVSIGAGCVELSVQHEWIASPIVGGHTPCNVSGDCPDGQTCNAFINTCVDK